MPKKHQNTTTTPESGRIYSSATQSDYFVMENREITPAELKQFEILVCGTDSKK